MTTAAVPKIVKAGLHRQVPADDTPEFPFKDAKLTVKPELRFVSGGDEEADHALAAAIASATPRLTVTVNTPYRVSHGGRHYTGGQTFEMPADPEHRYWLIAGWVRLASEETQR